MNEQLPQSDHFHLRKIAEGVFAALARPNGMAGCNSGIIDLGGRVAVVDTFLSPDAAANLRDAAKHLTNRPVDLVLLTHHHYDHIWGNQAFPQDICIFASEETRRMIQERGSQDLKQNRENSKNLLQQTQEKIRTQEGSPDPELQTEMEAIQKKLALIDTIQLRHPNLTAQGPVSFFGNKRTAEFIPYAHAHSPGNSIIFLPKDGIVFAGDLLFSGMHPFIGDGDPQGWIDVLGKIEALQPETVVPGHGALSTLEDIRELRDYLETITQKVRAFVQAGKRPEQLEQIELPEPYASWQTRDQLMRSLNSLYQWYSQEQSG